MYDVTTGSERWQKVPGLIKDCEATARNLDEGTEYDFRVMAVNEHGESKPLVTSEAIKAKHPFGRHRAQATAVFRQVFVI